jgi:hypothetical protein
VFYPLALIGTAGRPARGQVMTQDETLNLIKNAEKLCKEWFVKLEEADNKQAITGDGKYKFKAYEFSIL